MHAIPTGWALGSKEAKARHKSVPATDFMGLVDFLQCVARRGHSFGLVCAWITVTMASSVPLLLSIVGEQSLMW
jgi:hypothetical protein